MFKKIIYTLCIPLLLFSFINQGDVFAQQNTVEFIGESEEGTSQFIIEDEYSTTSQFPPIFVEDITIQKNTYSSGQNIEGTITFSNAGSINHSDIYYSISLLQYNPEDVILEEEIDFAVPDAVHDTQMYGPIYIKNRSTQTTNFSFQIPKGIDGEVFGLSISAHTQTGLPLGNKTQTFGSITDGLPSLKLQNSYQIIDDTRFGSNEGPVLSSSSEGIFVLEFFNSTNEDIRVQPHVEVYNRIVLGEALDTYTQEYITIPAQSTSLIDVPAKYMPNAGVYVALVTLLDEQGYTRASRVQFRYIIDQGLIATIQTVTTDSQIAIKNTPINVTVSFSGAPQNIQTGQIQTIGEATLSVRLYDTKTNALIGESSVTDSIFDVTYGTHVLSVVPTSHSQSVRAEAQIHKGDTVLWTYDTVITPEDEIIEKDSNVLFYVLSILAVIILTFILVFIRNKKHIPTVLFIFVSVGTLGFVGEVWGNYVLTIQESFPTRTQDGSIINNPHVVARLTNPVSLSLPSQVLAEVEWLYLEGNLIRPKIVQNYYYRDNMSGMIVISNSSLGDWAALRGGGLNGEYVVRVSVPAYNLVQTRNFYLLPTAPAPYGLEVTCPQLQGDDVVVRWYANGGKNSVVLRDNANTTIYSVGYDNSFTKTLNTLRFSDLNYNINYSLRITRELPNITDYQFASSNTSRGFWGSNSITKTFSCPPSDPVIEPQLNLSCSVNPPLVDPNQSVNLTVASSGHTGAVTYEWEGYSQNGNALSILGGFPYSRAIRVDATDAEGLSGTTYCQINVSTDICEGNECDEGNSDDTSDDGENSSGEPDNLKTFKITPKIVDTISGKCRLFLEVSGVHSCQLYNRANQPSSQVFNTNSSGVIRVQGETEFPVGLHSLWCKTSIDEDMVKLSNQSLQCFSNPSLREI